MEPVIRENFKAGNERWDKNREEKRVNSRERESVFARGSVGNDKTEAC